MTTKDESGEQFHASANIPRCHCQCGVTCIAATDTNPPSGHLGPFQGRTAASTVT